MRRSKLSAILVVLLTLVLVKGFYNYYYSSNPKKDSVVLNQVKIFEIKEPVNPQPPPSLHLNNRQINNNFYQIYERFFSSTYNGTKGPTKVQLPNSTRCNLNWEIPDPTWWEAAAMIDCFIHQTNRYQCGNLVAMGNWKICQDKPYDVKPSCLVYSFGINYDYSFDDAMGKVGCEVHSFDPSMNITDHKRSTKVIFHKWGIAGFDKGGFNSGTVIYKGKPPEHMTKKEKLTNWTVRTLKSIKDMLGHHHKLIDVLKIDIEGTEWAVLIDMFETDMIYGVRQLLVEWHLFTTWPPRDEYTKFYHAYMKLRQAGFKEYHVEPCCHQVSPKVLNTQGHAFFVNTNIYKL